MPTLYQSTLTKSAFQSAFQTSPPRSPPSSPYNPHNLPDFSILSLNPEFEREKLKNPKLVRPKSNGGSDEDEDEVIEVSTPMMSISGKSHIRWKKTKGFRIFYCFISHPYHIFTFIFSNSNFSKTSQISIRITLQTFHRPSQTFTRGN
jgi:hypothetical protein